MTDVVRQLCACVCVCVATALGLAACGGGAAAAGNSRNIFVNASDATNIVKGQDIRVAGQKVGTIASTAPIDGGRGVRIELALQDRVWPLTHGTKMTLRWGGTVSFLARYIDLRPGADGTPQYKEGDTIPASALAVPTELDEIFATFDRTTRRNLKALLDNGGRTLDAARKPLRNALQVAPAAVSNASDAVSDLTADERALDTLVGSTARVVEALHRADPRLEQLISDTGMTLNAIGGEHEALRDTLAALPETLDATRSIAGRARTTLVAGGALLDRLAPGVAELRRTTAPLNGLLSSLAHVGPDAAATLKTATRETPKITRFIRRATAEMPEINGVAKQATTSLNCIRPYTPEIAAFFSNWGDFISWVDSKDHMIRANIQELLPGLTPLSQHTSAEGVKQFPGIRYAFPRPPGYNVNQPWFLPECHAGRDALDPTKDPEAKAYRGVQPFPDRTPAPGSGTP